MNKTSGLAVLFARASDEINNARRRADYETSRQIESEIFGLEALRFMNERVYNYSAVIEAMILSRFEDIEAPLIRAFHQKSQRRCRRQSKPSRYIIEGFGVGSQMSITLC